jgi:hypothetical protein
VKRFFLFLAALVAATVTAATPASAYWEYGHETVAAIAWKNVTPRTRAAIDALLKRQGLLETPTCPARSIEQASVWPDCVKKLGERFNYASSWHYQNVNICKPFDLKAPCKDGNCVSAQITRDMKLIKDPTVPVREKLQAVIFLVHFVGDLHMPLHAGDRDDLGGNRVRAAYGIYAPERFNLHSLWDGWLAERAISTPPSLVRIYSPEERATIAAGSVEDWSRESWQVARDVAYASALNGDPCGPVPERVRLDDATIEKLVEPARLQVERGGVRLARLIDEAFA